MPPDTSDEEDVEREEPSDAMPWHRLFGLACTDLFTGTGYEVDLERDLSLKEQRLDVIVVERRAPAYLPDPPDGLESLARYNLFTYKSHRQALLPWSLDEVLGHYVNCRKQVSPSLNKLLPEGEFEVFAVCTRFPATLAKKVPLTPQKDGVYRVMWGSRPVTIVVTSRVEEHPRNAIWEMFSAVAERVVKGMKWYRWRQNDLSTILGRLFEKYDQEGIVMPYTVEDYKREARQEVIRELLRANHREERRELLSRLPPEERLEGLDPEARLKGLDPEARLKGLDPEARLKGLSRREILEFLNKLESQDHGE